MGVLEIPESLATLSCATDIVSRVHEEGANDLFRNAKRGRWCRLAHMEPFRYLAQLLSEESGTVPDWEIEYWENRCVIRIAWRSIEQSGEAKELLKSVGTNGLEDWVELCLKLSAQRSLINESEWKL